MGHFLLVAWSGNSDAALARTAIEAARSRGYRDAEVATSAWIGVRGPRPPRLQYPGGRDLLVLGDLFEALDAEGGPLLERGADEDRARDLARRRWGRYIALFRTPRGQVRRVVRDPSGAHECAAWRTGGVQFVTSELSDGLMAIAAPPLSIDRDLVGGMLRDPLNATAASALVGIRVARAGELTDLDSRRTAPLWRPVDFIGARPGERPGDQHGDPAEAARMLRDRIDRCLAAFAGVVDRPGVEVSGGLDSAIVAGALARAGAKPRLWLNFFGPFREGDERPYVRSLGRRLGFDPTCIERAVTPMTFEGFEDTAGGPRPGLNGRDYAFDRAVAAACRGSDVDGLFTGKGGDGVFFQMGVPEIFADLLKEQGPGALFGPALPNLARWTRRSVWSVLRTALAATRPGPLDRQARALTIFNPESLGPAGDGDLHPWLHDLEDVAPARRLQIESVAAGLAYQGQCRRTGAADLIHPLLAQPVVELALGLPIAWLTGQGEGDRRLARSAFADALPPEILHRRSKGELTAYFGRQAAMSLPFLREHLLDGRLVERGLIDRGRTEVLLDADRLMWKGGLPDFTMASVVESWVRRWEARGAR